MACFGVSTKKENKKLGALVMGRFETNSGDKAVPEPLGSTQLPSAAIAVPAATTLTAAKIPLPQPKPTGKFKSAAFAVLTLGFGKKKLIQADVPPLPLAQDLKKAVTQNASEELGVQTEQVSAALETQTDACIDAKLRSRVLDWELPSVLEIQPQEALNDFLYWRRALPAVYATSATFTEVMADMVSEIQRLSRRGECDTPASARLQSLVMQEPISVGTSTKRSTLVVARSALTSVDVDPFIRKAPKQIASVGTETDKHVPLLVRQRFLRTVIGENRPVTKNSVTSTRPVTLRLMAIRGVYLASEGTGIKPLEDKREAKGKEERQQVVLLEKMSDVEWAVRQALPRSTSEAALQQWTHHAKMFCGPTEYTDVRGTLTERFDKWISIVRAINPSIGRNFY